MIKFWLKTNIKCCLQPEGPISSTHCKKELDNFNWGRKIILNCNERVFNFHGQISPVQKLHPVNSSNLGTFESILVVRSDYGNFHSFSSWTQNLKWCHIWYELDCIVFLNSKILARYQVKYPIWIWGWIQNPGLWINSQL